MWEGYFSNNEGINGITDTFFLSERRDLNPRPLAPQASALPGCATLRFHIMCVQDTKVLHRRQGLFPALSFCPLHSFSAGYLSSISSIPSIVFGEFPSARLFTYA